MTDQIDGKGWFARMASELAIRLRSGQAKRNALSKLLMSAITEGSALGVAEALTQGADPIFRSEGADWPLNEAIKHASLSVCKALLDAGAKVDAISGFGCRALHDALETSRGEDDKVRLLLERGARPDSIGPQDIAPLRIAIASEAPIPLARALLEHGANPNLPMMEGEQIGFLSSCSNTDKLDLAQMLVEYGADAELALSAPGGKLRRGRGLNRASRTLS